MMRITTLVAAALASFFLAACGPETTDATGSSGSSVSSVMPSNVYDMNDPVQVNAHKQQSLEECGHLKPGDEGFRTCHEEFVLRIDKVTVHGSISAIPAASEQYLPGYRQFVVRIDNPLYEAIGGEQFTCPDSLDGCRSIQVGANVDIVAKPQRLDLPSATQSLSMVGYVVQSITVN